MKAGLMWFLVVGWCSTSVRGAARAQDANSDDKPDSPPPPSDRDGDHNNPNGGDYNSTALACTASSDCPSPSDTCEPTSAPHYFPPHLRTKCTSDPSSDPEVCAVANRCPRVPGDIIRTECCAAYETCQPLNRAADSPSGNADGSYCALTALVSGSTLCNEDQDCDEGQTCLVGNDRERGYRLCAYSIEDERVCREEDVCRGDVRAVCCGDGFGCEVDQSGEPRCVLAEAGYGPYNEYGEGNYDDYYYYGGAASVRQSKGYALGALMVTALGAALAGSVGLF